MGVFVLQTWMSAATFTVVCTAGCILALLAIVWVVRDWRRAAKVCDAPDEEPPPAAPVPPAERPAGRRALRRAVPPAVGRARVQPQPSDLDIAVQAAIAVRAAQRAYADYRRTTRLPGER